MRAFRDCVEGAESASGLRLQVPDCPHCGDPHVVSLNTLGRFCYVCDDHCVTGEAHWGNWPHLRHLQNAAEDAPALPGVCLGASTWAST